MVEPLTEVALARQDLIAAKLTLASAFSSYSQRARVVTDEYNSLKRAQRLLANYMRLRSAWLAGEIEYPWRERKGTYRMSTGGKGTSAPRRADERPLFAARAARNEAKAAWRVAARAVRVAKLRLTNALAAQ